MKSGSSLYKKRRGRRDGARGTAVTSGPGDAPQTHAARRQPPPAARLHPRRGVVQTGGRTPLLLRGQSVRAAVRPPEVSGHEESRAGGHGRGARGQQQHRGWSNSAELHPEDHGQCCTEGLWDGSHCRDIYVICAVTSTIDVHVLLLSSARLCQRRPRRPSELPAPAGPQGLAALPSRRLLLPGPLRLRRGLSQNRSSKLGLKLGF